MYDESETDNCHGIVFTLDDDNKLKHRYGNVTQDKNHASVLRNFLYTQTDFQHHLFATLHSFVSRTYSIVRSTKWPNSSEDYCTKIKRNQNPITEDKFQKRYILNDFTQKYHNEHQKRLTKSHTHDNLRNPSRG